MGGNHGPSGMYTYVNIYIYTCVCVCVYVRAWSIGGCEWWEAIMGRRYLICTYICISICDGCVCVCVCVYVYIDIYPYSNHGTPGM